MSALSTDDDDDEDEVCVPALLSTLLRVSRVLLASPARLRRVRSRWKLAVSPTLATLQRLIVFISSISTMTVVVMGFLGNLHDYLNANQKRQILTAILRFVETAMIVLTYVFGAWPASRTLATVSSVLRQSQEIKTTLNWNKSINSERRSVLLILYIMWQIFSCIEDIFWLHGVKPLPRKYSALVLSSRSIIYYQYLSLQTLQLQWSITILELKSTLTLLNDRLEQLLLNSSNSFKEDKIKLYPKELLPYGVKTTQPIQESEKLGFNKDRIHHLKKCHGMICDLVIQVDQDNGAFILLSFMMLFLHLITTPHNLITDLRTSVGAYVIILRQLNWLLVHICQLMVLVEPCHRLRDQMERTRSLLSKMIGSNGYVDSLQLELFMLQAEMRVDALVPMGMFTIARPLLTSIVGGVATYLMIVFQIQRASELV